MPTTQGNTGLQLESTLTSRGQTTIPGAIRKALGLAASDKIRFTLHTDNTVTVSRGESVPDSDPLVQHFLEFIEQDIATRPSRIQAVTPAMVSRAQALVTDVEVDLDAPLNDDDE